MILFCNELLGSEGGIAPALFMYDSGGAFNALMGTLALPNKPLAEVCTGFVEAPSKLNASSKFIGRLLSNVKASLAIFYDGDDDLANPPIMPPPPPPEGWFFSEFRFRTVSKV